MALTLALSPLAAQAVNTEQLLFLEVCVPDPPHASFLDPAMRGLWICSVELCYIGSAVCVCTGMSCNACMPPQ